MKQLPPISTIKEAKRQFNQINDLLTKFLSYIEKNPSPEELPSLTINEKSISISFLECQLEAIPRIVRSQDDFAVEFIFTANRFDEIIEIWRFYLLPNENLSESLYGDAICGYDNAYVHQNLCLYVLFRLITSDFFEVSP